MILCHNYQLVVGQNDESSANMMSGDEDDSDIEDDHIGNNDGNHMDNNTNTNNNHNDIAKQLAAMNIGERVAPAVLTQARAYGSMLNWVRTVQWKHQRNRNECAAIAEAVDVLLSEGVAADSLGIEILLRRINGVHLADSFNNWGVCTALPWTGPNNSLLPRNTLTSALKQAAQMEKLTTHTMNMNNTNKYRTNKMNKNNPYGHQNRNNQPNNNMNSSSKSSGTTNKNVGGAKQE